MGAAVLERRPAAIDLEAAAADMPTIHARALRRAVGVLREFYDPPAIFVFGSVVKGLAHATSDVDLLMRIGPARRGHTRGHEFKEAMAGGFPHFDLIVFNDEEIEHHFANPRSFLSSIMTTARPLHVRDPENEPLLRARAERMKRL